MKNYEELCRILSDINQLLPVLKHYGEQCNHITEFGVRDVVSTYAFMEAMPEVIRCYDLEYHKNMDDIKSNAIDIKFIIQDVLNCTIEKTDLLFIDTKHTYQQLVTELNLHCKQVEKFIIIHDVVTYGLRDYGEVEEDYHKPIGKINKVGLLSAALEFLSNTNQWRVCEFRFINNGLLVLSRCMII